eukprot:scaffold1940_cov228-Ochromonas_danica.AAC.3
MTTTTKKNTGKKDDDEDDDDDDDDDRSSSSSSCCNLCFKNMLSLENEKERPTSGSESLSQPLDNTGSWMKDNAASGRKESTASRIPLKKTATLKTILPSHQVSAATSSSSLDLLLMPAAVSGYCVYTNDSTVLLLLFIYFESANNVTNEGGETTRRSWFEDV